MNRKTLALVSLFTFACINPLLAQHTDSPGNPSEQPWLDDVHNIHGDEFCNNTDGSGIGHDIDCHDWSNTSPRDWSTSCNPHPVFPSQLECSASATVYCPGLGTGTGPGKDYINFSCYARFGKARSGILNNPSGYPIKKGVECYDGSAQGAVWKSCGCMVTSTTSSYFFGSPSLIIQGYYSCN